ncbi:dienelactone hydrolase [Bradyrhizobium sp. SSBR45G]|uniref:alpha/beta hydrolase family protein n=1 Tax=unclassified Bradyrhizobium TaxID=2631580 RepID=UPI002342A405|nr:MULTISPECIES: dienelactone hydrolase [unclassified Bradyrhizobium]GLH80847.1 dienelactone hydrolase [Bradyrhizobium sp. SSBR45G]GLH88319.1 dienelactone hydrolase [Bradyrhizobium sp. SSBR45R]
MSSVMNGCRVLATLVVCLSATLAQAAGLRSIDIPADAEGPAIHGMVWYPCAEKPAEIPIGAFILTGAMDCPLAGTHLPLVVASHGRGGSLFSSRDTAEVLADHGFVVAAINHPGDTARDLSRSGDLSVFVERPTDIRRLIDVMIGSSPFAAHIDRDRIGFFGFSRGGYTGLVLLGADPDWAGAASDYCQPIRRLFCQEILDKRTPSQPLTHDPRIKAAVLADPLAIFFSPASLAPIKVPVQLWASSRGGDGVLPSHVAFVDANLPAGHDYRVVPNSGHFAFFLCPPALVQAQSELCADAPGFDRAAFHTEFNAEVLAFFRARLARPAE